MTRWLPLALTALILPAADLKPQIDKIVQPYLDEKKIVGLVIGVVTKDGRQVFGYGKFTQDSDRVPDGDTVFEIGSITKVFTTLALADMVEEGLVKLDDPVQKYLPEAALLPKRNNQDLTLLHLATHTSGLPRVPMRILFKNPANPYAEYGPEELYEDLPKINLAHDLGSKVEYSNIGAGLLGHVLARRCQLTYATLIARRICEPLGLKDTGIPLAADQKARLAPGHTADGKPGGNWDFDALAGAGALRSTANDMLTFAAANLGLRNPGHQKAMAACHKSYFPKAREGTSIGLGWHLHPLPDTAQQFLWHNGGTGGYTSFLGLLKERKIGVIVLANTGPTLANPITDRIAVEVLKLLAQ